MATVVTGVGGGSNNGPDPGHPPMRIMAIQAKRLPRRKIKKEAADAAEHKSCELVIGSFYVFYFSFVRSLRAPCAAKTPWHVLCSRINITCFQMADFFRVYPRPCRGLSLWGLYRDCIRAYL